MSEVMYQYSERDMVEMLTSVALAARSLGASDAVTVEATGDWREPFRVVGETRVELPVRWPGAPVPPVPASRDTT